LDLSNVYHCMDCWGWLGQSVSSSVYGQGIPLVLELVAVAVVVVVVVVVVAVVVVVVVVVDKILLLLSFF